MISGVDERLSARLEARPGYAGFPGEIAGLGQGVDALYVHVPFCTTKCHYCDFYSLAGHIDQADDFLEALRREIGMWRECLGPLAPQTVFIGGGTPTLLDPGRLQRLLQLVAGGIDRSRVGEFTVEANPNTFDEQRAAALVAGGVDRVSFGAQSFVAAELATLQRDHDPENVPRAFEIARRAGIENINVDLIFGIPGQTLETWEYSLGRALQLGSGRGEAGGAGPEHMSCYSLIYEPNTAMTARLRRGEFTPIDEELELAMFEHVYRRMHQAGFSRYEVSNYARPGRQCRHNVHYWKGANWLAWGPGAAGHVNGWRWKNVASLAHYLEALGSEAPSADSRQPGTSAETCCPDGTPNKPAILPLTQMEHLPRRAWAGEVAVFWLRLSEGLDYAEFARRTGVDARPVLERVLRTYAELGFVELLPDRVRLTEKAVAVSNRILRDVLAGF